MYSALGRSGQRPELSQATGMLHPGQILRGSLPLLSPVKLLPDRILLSTAKNGKPKKKTCFCSNLNCVLK
jgi:hypothetical protein